MAENRNNMNGKDFLLGAIMGSVIGAATALLLAPKSGRELRGDLSTQYQNVSEKTQEIATNLSTKTKEIAENVGEKSQDWAGKAREVAGNLAGEIKSFRKTCDEATSTAETAAADYSESAEDSEQTDN